MEHIMIEKIPMASVYLQEREYSREELQDILDMFDKYDEALAETLKAVDDERKTAWRKRK
jgi:hypothetical protein